MYSASSDSNNLGNFFGDKLLNISRDIELARRYGILWFAIACFDTLALLPLEKRYIWSAKWSLAKVLYLINRWIVLLLQVLMQVLDAVPIPPSTCRHLYWIGTATGIFTSFVCLGILSIRVYALYDCSRKIAIGLTALAVCQLSLTIGSASKLQPINVPLFVAEALTLTGCGTLGHAQLKKAQYLTVWGTLFFVDAVVLVLTLHRSIAITRRLGKVPIVQALWRDGSWYYLVITMVHVVSIAMIIQKVHPRLKAINNQASLVMLSLMASRLVLSLPSQTSSTSLTSGQGRRLGSPGQPRLVVTTVGGAYDVELK